MEKITVNIKCREKVTYDQDIEVTQEQYDLLNKLNYKDVCHLRNRKEYSELVGLIDQQDIYEGSDELIDFEMKKIE